MKKSFLNFIDEIKNYKRNTIFINLRNNFGLAVALNCGLKKCTNNLIARIDPGDKIINNRFLQQVNFMNKNDEISVCGSFADEFYKQKKRLLKKPILSRDIIKTLKIKNPIIHSSVMFRKNQIDQVGGYPLIARCQDYFLWIKCYEKGFKFHNLPEALIEINLDDDMMKRRNFLYYTYEKKIYDYMFKKELIGFNNYLLLIFSRLVLRLMPNFLKIRMYNLR
jgi:glycosyltransferase involved in cell wall biosynthesis